MSRSLDIYYKILNPNKYIDESISKIIEVFVKYYGEEQREYIENKFKNIVSIGYYTFQSLKKISNELSCDITYNMKQKFLDSLSIEDSKKQEYEDIFFNILSFDDPSFNPIHKFYSYLNSDSEYTKKILKEDVIKFLNNFNYQVTDYNLDDLINSGKLTDFINKYIPLYLNILEEYKKEKNKYINTDVLKELNELNLKHKREYYENLIISFKQHIPKKEFNIIMDSLSNEKSITFWKVPTIYSYFGRSVEETPIIDAFSEKSNELLIHGSEYQKESIKNDRIEYFKKIGIDLGDDYEKYESSKKCREKIPSQQLVEEILLSKKHYKISLYNSQNKMLPIYKEVFGRLQKSNLRYSYDLRNKEFCGDLTCVLSNEDMNSNFCPLLLLSMSFTKEYLDQSLIHEFNHIYEFKYENIYEDVTGWDSKKNKYNYDDSVDYELFSEIINELIAQDITSLMHLSGVYIFNDKESAKIKGGCGYEKVLFLVEEFFNKYKDDIIKSRKDGKINIIYDKVGKENFDNLNKLINIFNNRFSSNYVIYLLQDLKNNIDNEDTRFYYNLCEQRDEILRSMEEYSKRKAK